MKLQMSWVGLILVALACSSEAGEELSARTGYDDGFAAIQNLTRDLYDTLPAARRARVDAPALLTTNATPFLTPCTQADGSNVLHTVNVSSGFVDFANRLSHARAIDQWERGYLKKYLHALALEGGVNAGKELSPPANGKRLWSDDTMNAQLSQFNQMAGTFVAIELAHHYLGHYAKYAAQLTGPDGRSVPINTLLTPQEWRDALMAGAANGLECGLRVEGIEFVFESIERMETRPAWTVNFLPPGIKAGKIKRDLDRLEKDFFDTSNGDTKYLGKQ